MPELYWGNEATVFQCESCRAGALITTSVNNLTIKTELKSR